MSFTGKIGQRGAGLIVPGRVCWCIEDLINMAVFEAAEIGMEKIARETALLLIEHINDNIDDIDSLWNTLDQDLATQQGVPYEPCTSDHVRPDKIHVGHRPSFIESDEANYPNLCVMSYESGAGPYRNFDQGEDTSITFYIEGMVKDGPYQPEDPFLEKGEVLVNKKVQRMVEAVHRILSANRTLNGLIDGFEGSPRVTVSDCLRRTNSTEAGTYDFYWSMFRIEYTVIRAIENYY